MTTTTTTMNAYVTYNAEYKVLICRQHQYAIPPDYITRHLRDSHQAIPLATRQAIVEYSKTLELVGVEDLATPQEPVEPVHGVKITNGFQCEFDECSALRGTDTSMKQHCWEAHKWVAAMGIKWQVQPIQTIFAGKSSKYVSLQYVLM
jgi:Orsellinic acid/F9775 biosynthesis cluster protein D